MTNKEKNIKVINAKETIKKRPRMYFGSRGINAEDICIEVSRGALVLGAKSVKVLNIDDWWFICADIDWLLVKTKAPQSFEHIPAFPELAVNSFRWEAFTNFFSDATYTTSKSGTDAVLANTDLEQEYKRHIINLAEWERIIGFKFNENA